jgi:hypothetical protein
MQLLSMGIRIGIELSPSACRLVELDGPPLKSGVEPATRVHGFGILPRTGPEFEAELRALRGRPAAVVLWGVGSDHRQVVVSHGSYDRMRREALLAARDAGVDTLGRTADIAPAATRIEGAVRQPVVLALAETQAIRTALEPLLTAGVRIYSVVTPADALASIARTRQALATPGGIEVYVALEETETCIALVRDGALFSALELPWGYSDHVPVNGELGAPRGEHIAAQLADAVLAFVADAGASHKSMTQVSICGDLPNLRTMTIPLMERLDVEVETLDSLFGIDAGSLPEGGSEFREQAAALRLAWAAAAAGRGPIDLMRPERQRARNAAFARAAVVAGVAAGLGAGLFVEHSGWARPSRVRTVAVAAPVTPLPKPLQVPASSPVQPPKLPEKSPVMPLDKRPDTLPAATAAAPLAAQALPQVLPPAPPRPALETPAPAAAPVALQAQKTAPIVPVVSTVPPVSLPVAPPRALPPTVAARTPPRPETVAPTPVRSVTRVLPKPAVEIRPVPLDAVLESILYSSDRRLAIIDGRILGLGDDVKGARIVDITPGAVLLRDGQGRLRSVTLGQ